MINVRSILNLNDGLFSKKNNWNLDLQSIYYTSSTKNLTDLNLFLNNIDRFDRVDLFLLVEENLIKTFTFDIKKKKNYKLFIYKKIKKLVECYSNADTICLFLVKTHYKYEREFF